MKDRRHFLLFLYRITYNQMYYIFVVNGREDKKFIMDELTPQLKDVKIKY